MSVSNNSANEYIRLAAMAELQYNKLLVRTLISQQSRIAAVLEEHCRSSRDIQIIYHCNEEIEKILERKKKLMEDMKQEFGVYFLSKSTNNVMQIKDRNENNSESENVSENEIEVHSNQEKSSVVEEKQEENSLNTTTDDNQNKYSLFACTYNDCSKEYKNQKALYNHVRRFHLKVKNHECEHCNARFYSKSDWSRHLRIHTGEKPFQCTICHRKFSQKSDLKRHSRIHTGEKPYQCTICKLKFPYKCRLENHWQDRHL